MAQKRMFDKAVIENDDFMDMSMSSKALYFLLGMEADDEGFVSPRRVMRTYGGNDDDLKVLAAKRFVIPFRTGVVVITAWNENNYLDKNRIKPTKYQAERKMLVLTPIGSYELNKGLTGVQPEESSVVENRVVENKIAFDEFWKLYPRKEGRKKAEEKWDRLTLANQQKAIVDVPKRNLEHGTWVEGFVPHAATYINGERWEDEIVPPKSRGQKQLPAVKLS